MAKKLKQGYYMMKVDASGAIVAVRKVVIFGDGTSDFGELAGVTEDDKLKDLKDKQKKVKA